MAPKSKRGNRLTKPQQAEILRRRKVRGARLAAQRKANSRKNERKRTPIHMAIHGRPVGHGIIVGVNGIPFSKITGVPIVREARTSKITGRKGKAQETGTLSPMQLALLEKVQERVNSERISPDAGRELARRIVGKRKR